MMIVQPPGQSRLQSSLVSACFRFGQQSGELVPGRKIQNEMFSRKTVNGRCAASSSNSRPVEESKQRPIILFDVMDTLVFDPFYTEVPKFFDMTLQDLFKVKHPKSWMLFEKGLISEQNLLDNFFTDGRNFDKDGFVQMMHHNYQFLADMEDMLHRLKIAGYEMHTCSNYPNWYRLIEGKLELSRFMDWTFISCEGPMKGLRKPDAGVFEVVVESLGVEPNEIILVDDREANVEQAIGTGLDGVCFKNARKLEHELKSRGLSF